MILRCVLVRAIFALLFRQPAPHRAERSAVQQALLFPRVPNETATALATASDSSSDPPAPALASCGFAAVWTGPGALAPLQADSSPLWKAYVELHARERAKGCGGRYLVYRCRAPDACGGFGDQMRSLASLLQFAVASNRAVLVDWEKPVPLHENAVLPHTVDWTLPPNCAWRNQAPRRACSFPLKHDVTVGDAAFSQTSAAVFGAAPVVTVLSTACLIPGRGGRHPNWGGLFSTPGANPAFTRLAAVAATVKQPRGCAFHFLFRLSPALLGVVRSAAGSLALGAVKEEAARSAAAPRVSVHWRTGDSAFDFGKGGNYWKTAHNVSVDSTIAAAQYRAVLTEMANCFSHADALATSAPALRCEPGGPSPVQLFSDSAFLKSEAHQTGFLTTVFEPVHVAKNYSAGDAPPIPAVRGLQETLSEVLLMAEARVFVRAPIGRESGFSLVAMELSWVFHGPATELSTTVTPHGFDLCIHPPDNTCGLGEPNECRPEHVLHHLVNAR